MKILLASAEAVPFVKIGGLGDIVPIIAQSVSNLGHEVKVIVPLYSQIDRSKLHHHDEPMIVNMGYGIEFARLWFHMCEGVEFLFVEFERYFGRDGVYGENGHGYNDNWERFTFFSRSVIDACLFLNWIPDVIHSHDWHTGLIPVLLKEQFVDHLKNTSSVFTIHNMGYHGYAPYELLHFVGLPTKIFNPLAVESYGGVNIMKGAITYADKITTVSSSYADEIKTKEYGWGLDDVLRYRAQDLVGICNAVDYNVWSPEKDSRITQNYSHNSLSGKKICKLDLQSKTGLSVDKNIFLIGIISRFVEQKGLDLVSDLLPIWLKNLHVQFVILGSGDKFLENRFIDIMNENPGRVSVTIGFNDELAHIIEAGADCFLMPSKYEPCGMNQMYSMLYGTLPIVHSVGGLRDTVENYDEKYHTGTGFMFYDFTSKAIYNTVCWACATYFDCPKFFKAMQKRAMQQDFSLSQFAEKYVSVYISSLKSRK